MDAHVELLLELDVIDRPRFVPVSYGSDMLAKEFLAAVLSELPDDDPVRPAVEALPKPVPYMNPGFGQASTVLVVWALRWLERVVKRRAEADPAFGAFVGEFDQLDLGNFSLGRAEEAERLAQRCAGLLGDCSERMVATHVGLAALALSRGDDKRVAESVSTVLVAGRGWSGYLLLMDLTQLLHRLGYSDRR